MGTSFIPLAYDAVKCRRELNALGRLLRDQPHLSERNDVLPFFKARRQLAGLIGTFVPAVGPATEIAYEYSFLGDFSADLMVGNRSKGLFLAVEFEDGGRNSLFQPVRGRSTTDWGRRLEHGFSQLVDWFRTLDDYKKTDKFRKEFGPGHIVFYGLLVVGRNAGLSDADRARLDWRSDRVVIDSHKLSCITFDDLYQALSDRLTFYPPAVKFGRS